MGNEVGKVRGSEDGPWIQFQEAHDVPHVKWWMIYKMRVVSANRHVLAVHTHSTHMQPTLRQLNCPGWTFSAQLFHLYCHLASAVCQDFQFTDL